QRHPGATDWGSLRPQSLKIDAHFLPPEGKPGRTKAQIPRVAIFAVDLRGRDIDLQEPPHEHRRGLHLEAMIEKAGHRDGPGGVEGGYPPKIVLSLEGPALQLEAGLEVEHLVGASVDIPPRSERVHAEDQRAIGEMQLGVIEAG